MARVRHTSHLALQMPEGFPQRKHWLASLFSVKSHHSRLQKIVPSAPDIGHQYVWAPVGNQYDTSLAQLAEAMTVVLVEVQAGCGLGLCCVDFLPKWKWWFDYQLQ